MGYHDSYQTLNLFRYSNLTVLVTILLFAGCQTNTESNDAERKRKLVLQWQEAWNTGQTDSLSKIITPDYTCHYLTDVEWKGIEGAKAEIANWRKLFPDWHEEVVDFVIGKDKVVIRYNSTGTHSGTYEGIDSTGLKIRIAEVSIFRIQDGKLAEQWCFPDDLGLKNQLLKAQQGR